VRRSKNAALVGASGIVVQETENTFKVVTRKNKSKGALRVGRNCFCPADLTFSISIFISTQFFFSLLIAVLPKQGSVFAFAVPLYSTEPAPAGDSGTNLGTEDGGGGGDDTRRVGRGTVLDGPHIEIELYGNQFCFRAADRAGRKFKHKETIEL
jgi:ribonuclease P protein subunit POP4